LNLRYKQGDINVLVLPEMAFTGMLELKPMLDFSLFFFFFFVFKGYVFKNLKEIWPYLEDAETGPSVQWAKEQGKVHAELDSSKKKKKKKNSFEIAVRLACFVVVGYPQKKGNTNLCKLGSYSDIKQRKRSIQLQ
jgi:protein N-terminal amidase